MIIEVVTLFYFGGGALSFVRFGVKVSVILSSVKGVWFERGVWHSGLEGTDCLVRA